MAEIVLSAHELTKRYGSTEALKGVSLSVEAGEIVGLLGPNGAGKTTLMRILAGLTATDSGEVEYFGTRVKSVPCDMRGKIGVVPQDIALFDNLTAQRNLMFFGRLYAMAGAVLEERVKKVLEDVGLSQHTDQKVRTFSGGMKRRLNIAAGMLHNPRFVLFDEPTVGVDPQSRTFILQHIARMAKDGVGILYSTHYMEEAEGLCDRVAIMDNGRILVLGTKQQIFESVEGFDVLYLVLGGIWSAGALELGAMKFIHRFVNTDTGLQMFLKNGENYLGDIVAHLKSKGAEILGVSLVRRNLETVFLELTGKELRQ